MIMNSRDTIAAVATSAPGAIGIVRLSGAQSVGALSALFVPMGGGRLEDKAPRSLVYGTLRDAEGTVIDHVLATYSVAPHTYTGEDTAEVHCHGSVLVQAMALESLFAQGCRQAERGEFTQRAFLNGKLDLAQAEAVVDLIDAQSREGVRHAAGQLAGALSRRIGDIYSHLLDLMAHFCAVLDYPDEDIDDFGVQSIANTLTQEERALESLLATWRRGRQLTQGLPCAIVGRPNAGKSSLLNALLGYDRAIVTAIAGTTRDTIEERVELGGVSLCLIDTAGLRDSDDPIEQMGVERSRGALERAELILLLTDGTEPLTPQDMELLAQAHALAPTILVRTKCDLAQVAVEEEGICLSAKTGDGLDELERAIAEKFPKDSGLGYGELLTNARQAQAAGAARDAIVSARQALTMGITPDAVLTDVEAALAALGELTGQSVREDITGRIFERFCVGK